MTDVKERFRIVDQSLSMHARLRDTYRRRASAMNAVVLIGGSVALIAGALAPDIQEFADLSAAATRVIIVGASAFVLVGGVLERYSSHATKAGEHATAVRHLAGLKQELGALKAVDKSEDDEVAAKVLEQYQNVWGEIPPIPDKKFAALKRYHVRKVALSKSISERPGLPLWMHRVRIMLRDLRRTS